MTTKTHQQASQWGLKVLWKQVIFFMDHTSDDLTCCDKTKKQWTQQMDVLYVLYYDAITSGTYRSRAQLHAHNCAHTHKWHVQWHTTRLAAPYKCPTHATVASITVTSRPLKKSWQFIYWMPQVRALWTVLEAQLYTGVCSWDQNGCPSQFTSSICICVYTSHEIQKCGIYVHT